jgi:hypothetical protein
VATDARKVKTMNANKTTSYSPLSLMIDTKKKAIVMTKKFEKASRRVGSEEYDLLQKARADYPKYRVATRTTKANPNIKNLLNYQFMETYIQKHDESKLEDYELQRSEIEGVEKSSFTDIKDWFLRNFPEVLSFDNLRDAMLAA